MNTSGPPLPGISPSMWISATVAEKRPLSFLSVTGQQWGTVSARATAGVVGSNNCIYALDPTSSGALHVESGDKLISSCGVIANSSSSTATTIGGGGFIQAPEFSVVGTDPGYTGTINATKISTGVPPVTDPLAYLPAPTVGSCSPGFGSQYSVSSGSVTLNPGVYCGGIQTSGNANVTLNPGIYIINNGGLQIGGNSIVTGTGVMIYNTYSGGISNYGTLNVQDAANLRLTAPTSGTYAGIAFFNDRSVPLGAGGGASLLGGGTTSKIQGALYFPSVRLEISNGQMLGAAYTIVVAYQLAVTNNQFTVANDYSSLANGNPIKTIALYE